MKITTKVSLSLSLKADSTISSEPDPYALAIERILPTPSFILKEKKNREIAIFESKLVFLNLTNLAASLRFQLERIELVSVVFCFQPQQQCLRRYVSGLISFCEISSS